MSYHAEWKSIHRMVLGAALALVALARPLAAQDEALCADAHEFLVDEMEMAAVTEPDTIDDWRTGRMVPGCRVTAAGVSNAPEADIVRGFYAILRNSGWTRTPNPADAPREASLRFRKNGADCLFNYYNNRDSALGTDAEDEVDRAVVAIPGQRRFNFLVMCMPAMDVE